MRLLFWIVVVVLAAVLVLFGASNREAVALALWPLGFALELPLYVAILGALVIGFAIGAGGAWLGGRRLRREARQRRRRILALERELAATQAQLSGNGRPSSPAVAMHG